MKTLFTDKQVAEIVINSLYEQFNKVINADYSSPILAIAKEVIAENTETIKKEFQSALDLSFNDKEFRNIVREEFKRKVAKTLVGKLEGEVDRAVAAIRNDQTIRARMILAIEKIVNEEKKD